MLTCRQESSWVLEETKVHFCAKVYCLLRHRENKHNISKNSYPYWVKSTTSSLKHFTAVAACAWFSQNPMAKSTNMNKKIKKKKKIQRRVLQQREQVVYKGMCSWEKGCPISLCATIINTVFWHRSSHPMWLTGALIIPEAMVLSLGLEKLVNFNHIIWERTS